MSETPDASHAATIVDPLDDRVLVQRIMPGEKRVGSLFIPDAVTEKVPPKEARVLAVGPGRATDSGARVPMTVAVGDQVLIGSYAGIDVHVDEIELTLIREDDILARIREKGA